MTVEIILGLFNGYPRYNKTGNRVNEYELIKEKATSLMGAKCPDAWSNHKHHRHRSLNSDKEHLLHILAYGRSSPTHPWIWF